LAHAYAERLRVLDPADFPAFAYTATAGRPVHPYRIVVRSSDPRSAADALTRWASEGTSPVVTPLEAEAESIDLPPRRVIDLPRYPWQHQRYGPLDELPDHEPSPTGDDTGVDLGPLPLYHLRWESIATPAADAGTVVIAGDDDALVTALASAADQVGASTVVLGGDTVPDRVGPMPRDRGEWARFWQSRPDGERAHLVLAMAAHPLPHDALAASDDVAAQGAAVCAAVCDAVQALDERQVGQRALILTQATRRVVADDLVEATDHGLLNGLAPVLGLESSAFGALVDLPPAPSTVDLCTALRTVAMPPDEDVLAVRAGQVYAARLRPAPDEFTPDLPI